MSTFPFVGLVMAVLISAVFYLCQTHDVKIWQQLFSYHATHLLNIERPLYEDFYSKRLSIDHLGSEKELDAFKAGLQPKDNQQLTKSILADRSFRLFLEQKAPIYFSPNERAYWSSHNQAIKEQLTQLSSYQFGILSERFTASPKFANLFSYIFVDTRASNVLTNTLLFLLLCIVIERYIKRRYLVSFIVGFSLVYACVYVSITDAFSRPLVGLNALLYMLFACVSSIFLQHLYRQRFSDHRLMLLIGLSAFCLKVMHDIFYQTFSKEELFLLLGLCIITLICLQKLYQHLRHTHLESSETPAFDSLSEATRASYAEAMKGLSRFNFNYARQRLRLLVDEAPHASQILNSSYHLEKLKPEDAFFGRLAQARIDEALIRQDYSAMRSIFQDIQHSAPNRNKAKKHIDANYYLKMLVCFLAHNDTEKAEHAFMFLELAGEHSLVQEACLLLIKSFSEKQRDKKKQHYEALYQNYLVTN